MKVVEEGIQSTDERYFARYNEHYQENENDLLTDKLTEEGLGYQQVALVSPHDHQSQLKIPRSRR